jgi:hypothetical protein
MKRTDLIRKLEEAGCGFVRHGGNHDWYRNPKTCRAHLEEDRAMTLVAEFKQASQPVSGPPHAAESEGQPRPTAREFTWDATIPQSVTTAPPTRQSHRAVYRLATRHENVANRSRQRHRCGVVDAKVVFGRRLLKQFDGAGTIGRHSTGDKHLQPPSPVRHCMNRLIVACGGIDTMPQACAAAPRDEAVA